MRTLYMLIVLVTVPLLNFAKECVECHAHFDVLPEEHEKVVFEVSSCHDCHAGVMAGKTDKFASGIHIKHADVVGCGECHIYEGLYPFGIKGSGQAGKETSEQELITEKMKNWQVSKDLDNRHAGAGVFCTGCHGAKLPEFAAEVENSVCLMCHGPVEELQKKSEPAEFKDRNPHKSHLGEVACTICHHMHTEQEIYCISCHPKFVVHLPSMK